MVCALPILAPAVGFGKLPAFDSVSRRGSNGVLSKQARAMQLGDSHRPVKPPFPLLAVGLFERVELLRYYLSGVHPAGWRSEHAQVRAFGFAVSLYEGTRTLEGSAGMW